MLMDIFCKIICVIHVVQFLSFISNFQPPSMTNVQSTTTVQTTAEINPEIYCKISSFVIHVFQFFSQFFSHQLQPTVRRLRKSSRKSTVRLFLSFMYFNFFSSTFQPSSTTNEQSSTTIQTMAKLTLPMLRLLSSKVQ